VLIVCLTHTADLFVGPHRFLPSRVLPYFKETQKHELKECFMLQYNTLIFSLAFERNNA